MDAATRRLVRQRADDRCEYCHLPQFAVDGTFHVEHVIPRQHRGSDDMDNLALACDRCNLTKGPNVAAFDTESGELVALFHTRQQDWHDHFEFVGAEIVGKTSTGRATATLLQVNQEHRLQLRASLLEGGEMQP